MPASSKSIGAPNELKRRISGGGRLHLLRILKLIHPTAETDALTAGQRRPGTVDKSNILTTEMPHLRIVPQELWDAVQTTFEENRGKVWKRGSAQAAARGYCEMRHVQGRTHHRPQRQAREKVIPGYGCGTHKTKRNSVCAVKVIQPQARVHSALMTALLDEVLTPEAMGTSCRTSCRECASPASGAVGAPPRSGSSLSLLRRPASASISYDW